MSRKTQTNSQTDRNAAGFDQAAEPLPDGLLPTQARQAHMRAHGHGQVHAQAGDRPSEPQDFYLFRKA